MFHKNFIPLYEGSENINSETELLQPVLIFLPSNIKVKSFDNDGDFTYFKIDWTGEDGVALNTLTYHIGRAIIYDSDGSRV